jgi:drug/metabolite transporter (DMT)-like permease
LARCDWRPYSEALGTFLALTTTPDDFAATHPFEPHVMSLGREHRWSIVLFVLVGFLGLALLFMPNPWAGGLGGYHEYQH